MTTATQRQGESRFNTPGFGTQIPFEAVNEQGCYISNLTGHLLRIPEDAVKPGRSPVMSIVGRNPIVVTKISNDPYIPLTKARILAADCDVSVNF